MREHPALRAVFQEPETAPYSERDRNVISLEHTTSLSLARALAVGCLSRLDPDLQSVDIWDPAVGSGFSGFMLCDALQSAGVQVRFRGQDVNEAAVTVSNRRFTAPIDAVIARGSTIEHDMFPRFRADLVIVDAPWGMDWRNSASAVRSRQGSGAFDFGLPAYTDSAWLFISLALEKLRSAAEGGGRVAALISPGALSIGGSTGAIRRQIVDAGLLESVTRLPVGLAPNTSIPLYLVTFTNQGEKAGRGEVMIADMQTQFTTERGRRSVPIPAFQDLEAGLRTGRPGARNRTIPIRQLTRREARLSRLSGDGHRLSWRVTSYNDTAIDARFLEARYGSESRVELDGEAREIVDFDPSRIFGDGSGDLARSIEAKGWPTRRLIGFLARGPEPASAQNRGVRQRQIFVPTTQKGKVAVDTADVESGGRVLSLQLDPDEMDPRFLAAWLNSEQGVMSRRRAIDAASSGAVLRALRSDTNSLMRWADEVIVPVPARATQVDLASADERLGSFQAELRIQRERIWASPESADEVVSRLSSAFDDSLSAWLDQLPFPIASALWTAETAQPSGEQQRSYFHAWEAIVAFHATVLLSASRSVPGGSSEIEGAIQRTLQRNRVGIGRASLGTWAIIIEKTSKEFRDALSSGDADDVARVRRAFGDLSRAGIERLISKQVIKKFRDLTTKRNQWLGHTGYTPEEESKAQIVSLVTDLSELRELLGDVWAQLFLVRAGSAKRGHDGWTQSAEVAVGTRTPFAVQDFEVGDPMIDGCLYLLRDGSESPLRLIPFVQLRATPDGAQYTSYFYSRTDGSSVRMVSYQYGPEREIQDDVERFRDAFGSLARE